MAEVGEIAKATKDFAARADVVNENYESSTEGLKEISTPLGDELLKPESGSVIDGANTGDGLQHVVSDSVDSSTVLCKLVIELDPVKFNPNSASVTPPLDLVVFNERTQIVNAEVQENSDVLQAAIVMDFVLGYVVEEKEQEEGKVARLSRNASKDEFNLMSIIYAITVVMGKNLLCVLQRKRNLRRRYLRRIRKLGWRHKTIRLPLRGINGIDFCLEHAQVQLSVQA